MIIQANKHQSSFDFEKLICRNNYHILKIDQVFVFLKDCDFRILAYDPNRQLEDSSIYETKSDYFFGHRE